MKKELLHRKESVILTAIEIIDELGINGLSTREIAKREGISEGTLFRHFHSKIEIISAVLDYFSKFDTDIFETVRLKQLSFKDAILFSFDLYATYYENYPAITAITQLYGVFLYETDLADKVKDILKSRRDFLIEIIQSGQQTGEVNPNIESEALADMIQGYLSTICLRWKTEKYSFSLRNKIMTDLTLVLSAFRPQQYKEAIK